MRKSLRRSALLVFGCLLSASMAIVPAASAQKPDSGGHAAVRVDVQTYNLDLGADLTPLFGATNLQTLQAGAAKVYGDVVASMPEERMRAIAAIMDRQRADVVGLQEVALWRLAPITFVGGLPVLTGSYTPSFDFLALLLHDLDQLGLHYEAVSTNVNFDSGTQVPIPIPISATTAARYTDRNVILVRQGSHLQTVNPQQANFQATFTVTLLGITVQVHRGWASIDLIRHGRIFRFFDTHLEAYGLPPLKDQVRNPQAAELAALVRGSAYPPIVVGDINARPTMCEGVRQPPDPEDANTVAYGILVGAGLTEVWPLVHPRDPCSPASWTSGQNSLVGPVSTLTHRIDDVFISPEFSALRTYVVGDTPEELSTPHGLWPSDHASTVATIRLDAIGR